MARRVSPKELMVTETGAVCVLKEFTFSWETDVQLSRLGWVSGVGPGSSLVKRKTCSTEKDVHNWK